MDQNGSAAVLAQKVKVKTGAGEDVEASVVEVLDDMRRVYEAVRVLHPGSARYDLSGPWLAELAVKNPHPFDPETYPMDKIGEAIAAYRARTDIEAPCVVCGELLARTRWERPYHPGCKDRYDELTKHETQYGVTATKRDGVTTKFTNLQWQDHRPRDPGATFIEKAVLDNTGCPICFPSLTQKEPQP